MAPPESCTQFRRDRVAGPPEGAVADAHLDGCAECRAWLDRRDRLAGALGALRRLDAPAALLPRLEHEFALGRAASHPAPAVLGRLVGEEVAEGARAPLARALAGLPRLDAPDRLEDLVAAEIASTPTVADRRPSLMRLVKIAAPSAAAAALVIVGLVSVDGADRPEPRLRLVMLESSDELSPFAARLAEGLRGLPLDVQASGEVER
jgi:hypothetical protein